jgi:phage-related minor tail protein
MFWEDWYSTGIGSLTKLGAIAKLLLGEQIFDNLREGLETAGVGDFVKTMSEGLVKAATMFEDALADAVINGKADFDDLANHLKQVLAKAMIQKFITGPIMGLFGLAKGGPAKAGQPYIVGEEGPELFVPKNSGTVVPNHALGNMSGGPGMGMGGQQVTYNINAVDTQSFQQALARDPEFLFNVTQKGARSLPSRG